MLLITDGEVWDTKRMIASAQRSGHRVFVIGVGTVAWYTQAVERGNPQRAGNVAVAAAAGAPFF